MVVLRLSFIEECYLSQCFGNQEPTHIIMSQIRCEELRGMICKLPRAFDLYPTAWFQVNGPLKFNNADVFGLVGVSDDHLWVYNHLRPQRFNQRYEIR